MKICILAPRFPFPELGGDTLRLNKVARYLKKQGHELTLISFYDKEVTLNEEYYSYYDKFILVKRKRIVSMFFAIIFLLFGKPIQCGYYYSPKFKKTFLSYIKENKSDIYLAHLLRTTKYLEKTKLFDNSIVEMSDALSKTYSLSSNAKLSLKKIVYSLERKRIKKYEQVVIHAFRKVVLVSQKDIDYLKDTNTGEPINSLCLHTNGVDFIYKRENSFKGNVISFVGNLRTLQNQDSVLYFIDSIFPLIKKEVPDAVFKIIGAEPSKDVLSRADGVNVIVLGEVPSVEKELVSSKISVAPIRVAAGIQNKVLVSMACGVPVVLSNLISGPIPELIDRENCFIAEGIEEFARKCIELMKGDKLNASMAEKGYELVKNNYSWDAKLEGYEVL